MAAANEARGCGLPVNDASKRAYVDRQRARHQSGPLNFFDENTFSPWFPKTGN